MSRNRGEHLEWFKVKSGIIKFIISSDEAVPEPVIRKYLEKKYGIVDQGNIKKHLRDLQYQPNFCIEKIPPKQRGFANHWDIRKIENVKNIRLRFPAIRLNIYRKSLNIVLKDRLQSIDSPIANEFRILLFLSASFFDFCLKTSIGTLYDKAYEIYQFSFDKYGTESPEEWEQKIAEDMSQEIARDMFPKMLRDIPVKLKTPEEMTEIMLKAMSESGIKNVPEEMVKTIAEEKVKKTNEEMLRTMSEVGMEKIRELVSSNLSKEAPRNIPNDLVKICRQYTLNRLLVSDIIFEHFFHRDIIDDTVSSEEIEFVNRKKEMRAYFKANPEINLISKFQAYDDFYIKYFEECTKNMGKS